MDRYESGKAALNVADGMGVVDDAELDLLADDELFAAYAYLFKHAEMYSQEVDSTMAGDGMKGAAACAADDCYDVAHTRAEELLGRKLERDK